VWSRKRLGIALLLCVVLFVVVVAVALRGEPAPDPKATGETGASGLASFYRQKLSWTDCDSSRCTWVKVPIDYDKPGGATLRLRVKVRQADSKAPIGRLFINPGGPGASGVEYLSAFVDDAGEKMLRDYDIVGFDPRGVGSSTPLKCLSDKALDEFANIDPDPDDEAEIHEFLQGTVTLGDACRDNSGELAGHVSTLEAAKDIDILRTLLGEKKLDYYGASYGTQLGATYAQLFPHKVGRMVLDGAVDPTLSAERQSLGQAEGFQRALTSYIADCVQKTNCPLGTDPKAAETKLADFLQRLDRAPLKTDGKRVVTESMGFYGIAITLYDRVNWPALTAELSQAFRGDGTIMLNLADQYFGRRADGSYKDNSSEVIFAVRCLDSTDSATVGEVLASIPAFEKISPAFGRSMAWGAVGCLDWPLSSKSTQIKIKAKGAPPILVVGTTRDPATPYEWAESLAKQLDSGVLVTREGDGHTGYHAGNACIDAIIDDFFLAGDVPKDGAGCKAP
jgi:pimeloyl-ACP methyl ester carboxylesterase